MYSFGGLLVLILTAQFAFQYTHGQVSKKFFRKDFTYLEKSESFYKVHTIHRTWLDAKIRCAMEGASLWYPEDQAEADAVITHWNQTQPYFHWVYVGISDSIAKGVFETIDGSWYVQAGSAWIGCRRRRSGRCGDLWGRPLSSSRRLSAEMMKQTTYGRLRRPVMDVFNVWAPGEPNDVDGQEGCVILRRENLLNDDRCDKKYPFICKKTLDTLEWNSNCDMPNPEYVYNEALGRCYKFHLVPRNWTEAVMRCSAEQSYLAVLNSQNEANYLIELTDKAPKDKVGGNYLRGAVHLGFHNRDGDGWKTIKGTTIDESGYTVWANQQPDGGDNEKCGTMFYNGQLNDLHCDRKCFYICEHDIGKLSDSFNERFGD